MYAGFSNQCKQPECLNCVQHFSDLGHGFAGAAEGVTLRRNIKITGCNHFMEIMGTLVGWGLRQCSSLALLAYIFFSLTLVFVAVKNKPVRIPTNQKPISSFGQCMLFRSKVLNNYCAFIMSHTVCYLLGTQS